MLEMEELETLVGNSSRKRLGGIGGPSSRNKKQSGKLDTLLSYVTRGDLLSKVVVSACVILLVLLYMSGQDDPKPIETRPPTFSNTIPPPVIDTPTETKIMEPPSPATADDTASPTDGPTGFPTQASTGSDDSPADDADNNAFLYSKYATVLPLVDHPFPNNEVKEEYAEKYGKWHFWDGDEEERPMEDYTAKYPNRDMPGEDFPDDAWQADAVYVNHILNDADQLIGRTMEAIFVEYGKGKPLPPEGT